MAPLAHARIVVWEGGSLWVVDSTRLEQRERRGTDFHAHHAVQVVLALQGKFRLSTSENSVAGGVAAVAPDTPHIFEADGTHALLFVEPESLPGRAISASLFAHGGLSSPSETMIGDFASRIATAYQASSEAREQLTRVGRELVERMAATGRPRVFDPRVRRVVAWAAQRGDQPVSLADAADVAGLSAGRLRHLFVQETGLSFKTYLLWLRLTRAVTLMADGRSLTDAAHEAGFSDSAHFSRTFRRMFGVAPVSLKIT